MSGTDGVLVIDKPPGMTSHDVVDRIRKLFDTKKVGHAGTLDPDATGVLVLGLGRATRILSYAQAGPKSYEARARLGQTTTTLDASGDIVDERPVEVSEEDVRASAERFVGDIEQVPPMVSAVRVGGERLYKKARRGEEVERAARPVTVYELDIRSVSGSDVELFVRASGGTYIRSLVADLGEALGCGAHMTALRRLEAAGFTIDDAVPLDDCSTGDLRPVADAVRELARLEIDAESARRVSHGQQLPVQGSFAEEEAVALLSEGELLAVYKRRADALVPERVLA